MVDPGGARRARDLAVDARPSSTRSGAAALVHSDFNPKNLLVDPGSLAVTGLLDWEYAHAGHPFTDLGNLLRFERDDDFTAAVLGAYVARRGGTAAEALSLARAADLWALLDLAPRRADNPVARRPTGCCGRSPGRGTSRRPPEADLSRRR